MHKHRAARFITNEYSHLTRVTPIVKSLNLETLEGRRSKSKVVIIHKALNSNLEIEPNKETCCNPQTNIGTRTPSLFHMQGQMRTNTPSSRVAL